MKCRAKQVRKEALTEAMAGLYGEKCLSATQSGAALLLLEKFPWFRRGDRLSEFFDGQAGICEGQLDANAYETLTVRDRRGTHRADKFDRFEEAADNAEFRLTRELDAYGIDAAELWDRAEAEMPEKVFLGDNAVHKDARVAWYAWVGRRAVRIWIASAALSILGFELPSGRRRFSIRAVREDFALPLADFVSGWLGRFIAGRDRDIEREKAERKRKLFEEYAVDLTPVSRSEGKRDEVLRSSAEEIRKAEKAAGVRRKSGAERKRGQDRLFVRTMTGENIEVPRPGEKVDGFRYSSFLSAKGGNHDKKK